MNIEPLDKYLGGYNKGVYDSIRNLFPRGSLLIAGGAARQIFLNERLGSTDVDCYFPSRNKCNEQERRLVNQFHNSKHSVNASTIDVNGIQVQLNKKICSDDPCEIFDRYDMTCCMFAVKDNLMYFTDEAAEHATNKRIYIKNSTNGNIQSRVGKYLKKGFIPLCPLSTEIFLAFVQYANAYVSWNNKEPDIEDIFAGYFGTEIRY